MGVTVIYNFQPAEGESKALVQLLNSGRDMTLAAAGCESVDVYQGVDDAHDVVMVEQWTSREAHQGHFERQVKTSGIVDRVMTLLVEPPQPVYYERRN